MKTKKEFKTNFNFSIKITNKLKSISNSGSFQKVSFKKLLISLKLRIDKNTWIFKIRKNYYSTLTIYIFKENFNGGLNMNPSTKKKLIMVVSMIAFMLFYMVAFGTKNMVIGMVIVLAAFMNLGNDLSFRPKASFIRTLFLLLVLGISAYLNNPLTIWGCILTFVVVFGTTFTSYNLFGSDVYLPYLMCYFMMISSQVTLEDLPVRLLALTFGAVFIVGLNIIVNRKNDYKLSKESINVLINELDNAIDLKLKGKPVSKDNFKTASDVYLAIFNKFEFKYFPTKKHQKVLSIIKSFQYIGIALSNHDFSSDELNYIREVLSKIKEINSDEIFSGIKIETDAMPIVLLNLEVIANVVNSDSIEDISLPDKKTIRTLLKSLFKREFSFKSPKFIFAFKMAFMLFIWQLLTLMFNLPFTKWLYFITLPLMMPYIDDLAYTAKARIKGTLLGVFIFSIILILLSYISISPKVLFMPIMFIGIFIMIFKLKDKFILTTATTIMSVMSSLMYITPPQAIRLKVLWVVVGTGVVTLFNFKFMPYSIEKETEKNLNICYKLNKESIDLIKEKCNGVDSDKKTNVLVLSNIIRGNIELTNENKSLYELQIKITDICNFILNYLDIYPPSKDLKSNLIDIIDTNGKLDDNLNVKDRVIASSMEYVMKLYNEESEII